MKRVRILLAFAVLFQAAGLLAFSSNENQASTLVPQEYADYSVEDFLALTPNKIEAQSGKKLSFKEISALKTAQKQVKKSLKDSKDGPKSQIVALILCIALGAFGVHRFYLGYTKQGIIQLVTLGGCGIWALIDLINIIKGDLGPADGSDYDPKLGDK